MNAQDLLNIKWTLENGQTHERVELLQLITRIVQLTSHAMCNTNESSPHRRQRTANEGRSTKSNQNRGRVNSPLGEPLERSISIYENETSSDIFENRQMSPTLENTHIREAEEIIQNRQMSPTLENTHIREAEEIIQNRQMSPTLENSHIHEAEEIIQDPSMSNDDAFNLSKLLKLDLFADVIAHYEEHGRFDEMTRKQLMRKLCDELLKGPRLSNEAISQICNDVCLTFMTERKTPYYDKQPGMNPTGTFFYMYQNGLRKKSAPKQSRKRKAQDSLDEETLDLDAFSDKVKESVNFFKNFQHEKNTEIVNSHWSDSHFYRRAALRKKSYENVTYMLDNWPVLKTNYAHLLKEHGPSCAESLIKNWNLIVRITDNLYGMISKNNKKIRSLIAMLPSKDINHDNLVLSKAFHYLVPPRATVRKFTLTMDASLKSFYQFATSVNNLEEKIKERADYCLSKNIQPHPIIFGFNRLSKIQYVVVINNLRFYFNEFLNAFDLAFKLFIFFNIPFPPESLKFWNIINSLFYDVNHGVPTTGKTYLVIQAVRELMKNAGKAANSRSRTNSRARSSSRSRSNSRARSNTRSRSNSRARSNSPMPSTSSNRT